MHPNMRAFMSAVSAISAIFAFSFSLISLGVPAGAQIENQIGTSASAMPSSVVDGTSETLGDAWDH